MRIIRKEFPKNVKCSLIPNEALFDKRISSDAFRLYSLLYYDKKEDLTMSYLRSFKNMINVSDNKIDTCIKELKNAGYLIK